MNRKTIAVDIDGVLADWVGTCVPILDNILQTNVSLKSNDAFSLHTAFGVSKKRMHKAIDDLYEIITVKDLKSVVGSQEAIECLSKDFNIIAITARPKKLHSLTEEWIKENYKNEITVMLGRAQGNSFGAGLHLDAKIEICKNEGVVCLVEDNPCEILALLKTQTEPICLKCPWNGSIANYPKVPRGDWNFLTKYILEKYK